MIGEINDMKFLLDWLYVDKLSDEDKGNLTLFNNQFFVSAYDEMVMPDGSTAFRIPRFYKPIENDIDDMRCEGEDIDLSLLPQYKPRDERQDQAIKSFMDNDHGLIAAKVGFGKTFIAIDYICKLKKKALIVVHNEMLLKQWRDKVKEYTGRDDVVGIIKADKADFNKPICIAMVQTLGIRSEKRDINFLSKMYEANFGITIYDECHITATTEHFGQSTKAVYSKRIYGLSATPFRNDGLGRLIEWVIGPTIYEYVKFDLPVYVLMLDIPVEVTDKTRKYLEYGNGDGLFVKYASHIFKSSDYIDSITYLIKLFLNRGRNLLALSSIIKLLDKVYTNIDNDIANPNISVIHSAIKEDKRDFTKPVILSTFNSFKTGMDVPRLDSILFITPITSKVGLIQSIGRVTRDYPDKKFAIVLDITNSMYDTINKLRSYRMGYYSSLGFKMINVGSSLEKINKALDLIEKGAV